MRVRIGEIIETGEPLYLDVPVFIETRGLIVANSGGGKSYLMRVLAEQMSKYVQVGLFAKTDEYATIREKFDFLLCGDEKSDHPISFHAARLKKESRENAKHNERERALEADAVEAVQKMVELLWRSKQHFVVDLSAITNVQDRSGFAAAFLQAAVDMPRKFWHSVLLEVDEIHLLAPEEGKPVTKQPTVDVFSLTRKQGLCGVGATQRFSKLDKDPEAECNNVCVGRSVLDEDLRRSAKLLGFGPKRWDEIKHLNPGEWFVFGPAFGTKEVLKVAIDEAKTTHPRPGRVVRRRNFRKPSAAMRRALRELVVLPGKVVERRETIEALHAQITKLEGELMAAKGKIVSKTVTETREVEVKIKVPVFTKAQEKLLKRFDANLVRLGKLVTELRGDVDTKLDDVEKAVNGMTEKVARITVTAGSTTSTGTKQLPLEKKPAAKLARSARPALPSGGDVPPAPTGDGYARVDNACTLLQGVAVTRAQLALVAGYRNINTNTFATAMAEHIRQGHFTKEGAYYVPTGPGGEYSRLTTQMERVEFWRRFLEPREGEALGILLVGAMQRATLAQKMGYENINTNTFASAIGFLSGLRLVVTGGGVVGPDSIIETGAN